MATSLLLMSILALAPPAEQDLDPPARGAGLATGFAVASSAFGIALVASGFEARRAHTEHDLRNPCDGFCFDIYLDDIVLMGVGTWSNANAFALSAVAGHLWGRRDLARGRSDYGRAAALTTIGTLSLAAGLGLHIGGFLIPDNCATEGTVDAQVACHDGVAHRSIALTSVGAFAIHTGVGMLSYGGTMLRVQPNVAASRQGATVGLTLAF